jgi:hypothetical protein
MRHTDARLILSNMQTSDLSQSTWFSKRLPSTDSGASVFPDTSHSPLAAVRLKFINPEARRCAMPAVPLFPVYFTIRKIN